MNKSTTGDELIDVLGSGAVVLGPNVTCDGFLHTHHVRVQTHVHSDHMDGFSSSKGGGRQIVMSKETYQLLLYDNPDLDLRQNIHRLAPQKSLRVDNVQITLLRSTHMLGATQVMVKLKDGTCLGYSGDFSWPLDDVIQVDALVVDATYGKPDDKRNYSQAEAEEELSNLVHKRLKVGPVHIMANLGPAQRALFALSVDDVLSEVPVIANKKFCAFINIHRECSYDVPEVVDCNTGEGRAIIESGRYVRYWRLGQQLPNDIIEGTIISLTKYRTPTVIEQTHDHCYRVGFSNHADFAGTIEYVRRSGASFVVTDNYRGQNDRGVELARAIRRELGVAARPSSNKHSLAWGE